MKRGSCGKVCYASRQGAKAALNRFAAMSLNSRRFYYCKACEAYHLTSQAAPRL